MGEYSFSKIKNWSLEDRPREKLLKQGIQHLSNAEIIALILGSGTKNINAVDLARLVLSSVGNNLSELGKASIEDLTKIKGIGTAKAITLLAAQELGFRKNQVYHKEKVFIKSSQSAFDVLYPFLGKLEHEEFWILILNRAHKVINSVKISQGGLTGTVIDTRMILKHVLNKRGTSLIISHNHPSGNLKPSEADINITNKIRKASELMDISLLDHIIIADNTYFSFADEGILVE